MLRSPRTDELFSLNKNLKAENGMLRNQLEKLRSPRTDELFSLTKNLKAENGMLRNQLEKKENALEIQTKEVFYIPLYT